MHILAFALISVFSFSLAAAPKITPDDVLGRYHAENEINEPQLRLDLKEASFEAQFEDEKPKKKPKKWNGSWKLKGDKVTLSSPQGRCEFRYRVKMEFYAETSDGPGLECLRKKAKKPVFCPCVFRKDLE